MLEHEHTLHLSFVLRISYEDENIKVKKKGKVDTLLSQYVH